MTVLAAYPQPGKAKSTEVCAAFAAGCSGVVRTDYRLHEGDAAFYGAKGIETLFEDAMAHAPNWYYLDNSYFDKLRGSYFRVGHNQFQSVYGPPDFERMNRLGIVVKPWRKTGKNVLVVDQSEYHMKTVSHWAGGVTAWRGHVLSKLRDMTDRLIVCRSWRRDKAQQAAEFAVELTNTWIVVTHASAAACEALLQGIPVLVTDPYCAAASLAGRWNKNAVEKPFLSDERAEWAASLCASQWTLDEMRRGVAWRTIHGR